MRGRLAAKMVGRWRSGAPLVKANKHSWCNNPKFGDLYDEQDPILGAEQPGGRTFTLQGAPLRTKVREMLAFVTVRAAPTSSCRASGALRMLAEPTA